MKKPIGVMPLYDDERNSLWMIPGYMKMLEAQGFAPIMLPLTDNENELEYYTELCGGFLLTGGQDVSPGMYGEQAAEKCGKPCVLRDNMEKYILNFAVDYDKPVLGICRGIQIMNTVFGGTLYRDLPSEYGSRVNHCMTPPYDRAVHEVSIVKNTPLYKIIGKEKIGVNSYHHQAIKKLAPSLTAAAISEDGLTEAVYMENKHFIAAVQWHPELNYLSDENSVKLIRAFVGAI